MSTKAQGLMWNMSIIVGALAVGFLIHNFWLGKYMQPVDSQTFYAPQNAQADLKPLKTDVSFADAKRKNGVLLTEIQTSWGQLVFSTDGASLESLEFTREVAGKNQEIRTIFPLSDTERDKRTFLVAFDQNTPFFYELVQRASDEDRESIMYEAKTAAATIYKTFTVYRDLHKIDLTIRIVPVPGHEVQPRLFFSSPVMPDIIKYDTVSSIAIDKQDDFQKVARAKLETQKGWFTPTLFGTENRYVIHAMVKDGDHFAQRAYYGFADKRNLMSILEGPSIVEEQVWNLSFYCGPKEEKAIAAVDPRLEKALDYSGMLAPISRFLLMILNWLYMFLHNYGFAIVALTMLLQIFLFPLTMKSDKAMKHNAELQKKITYLKHRYKDDPEQFERERGELLKKMQGLSSFLPLVIQAMIFFALSRVLGNAIELYKAPLLWIPDLSATDPYYILPLCVMGGMFMRSKADDATQRISMGIVALVFGALMTTLSSGLVLYIACSSLYSGLQLRILRYLKIV